MRAVALTIGVSLGLIAPAIAQQTPEKKQDDRNPESIDLSNILSKMPRGISLPGLKKRGKYPPFAQVTKGMKAQRGLFTLWSYPPGSGKDSQKLLAQIPRSSLGRKFMLSTSVSGGGFFTGFPLEERCVYWKLQDDQLVLVEPNARYVVDRSKTVSDVVRRTYPDRIRAAVRVVTMAGADPVIDLGQLLKSSFANIGWMTGGFGGMFGFGGGSINSKLSKWSRKPKTFPQNVEVGVELAISSRNPPGSYDKKQIHYSFWALPSSGYRPRVADDRVGYFLTTNQDWGKPNSARDLYNRYIDRWQLQKRDPSLKVCEPKQPIVYYIEKTVPVRYRRAVRDGILEWNKAFEKIGFLNAIEVRQQTNDNEWKDLDPEDMRYSFFRWIVTGAGFAMGPHRSNPFTGQIYDADIIFDDAMVRYFESSADTLLPTALARSKASDPTIEDFMQKFPEWRRPDSPFAKVLKGKAAQQAAKRTRLRSILTQRLGARGQCLCDYAHGMKMQMAIARSALAGKPKATRQQLLYDVIKEVVMHEVGHTLGLRHNFAASTVWTLKEIKQRRTQGEATVGSVMDYNPILFFKETIPNEPNRGYFVTSTIGPYDYWAIEYGYRPFDGSYRALAAKRAKAKAAEAKATKATQPAPKPVKQAKAPGGIDPRALGGGGSIDLSKLPPDLLAKMPPQVKAMLKSGAFKKMLAKMKAGGGMPAMPVMPSFGGLKRGPSFTAAPSGEKGMLLAIASRSGEKELVYATDEDATFLGVDPRVNRFDMGRDPLDWANTRMELVDARLKTILKWAVKDRESWYHLQRAWLTLVIQRVQVIDYVGRLIGGQHFNRNHRGDPGAKAPLVPLPAKTQRDALAFIEKHVLRQNPVPFDAKILNHLAPHRWWHDGMRPTVVHDFPIRRLVGVLQWWVLFDRLFPNTLRRLHDTELKTNGADRYPVAEYLEKLQATCWDDATNVAKLKQGGWTHQKPFVDGVRRSLQREYLGLVENLVRRKPGTSLSPDLHAMIQYSLKRLSGKLGEAIATGKADFATQAHLDACKSRIDRMLAPKLDELRPRFSFGPFGRTAGPKPAAR